jgi:hypothetical protein
MKSVPSLEDRFKVVSSDSPLGTPWDTPPSSSPFLRSSNAYGPAGIQDLVGNPALHPTTLRPRWLWPVPLIQAGQDGVGELDGGTRSGVCGLARSPENDRAPGNTTIKGCQNLESGISWTDSGFAGIQKLRRHHARCAYWALLP